MVTKREARLVLTAGLVEGETDALPLATGLTGGDAEGDGLQLADELVADAELRPWAQMTGESPQPLFRVCLLLCLLFRSLLCGQGKTCNM